jgi:hypothetical protein
MGRVGRPRGAYPRHVRRIDERHAKGPKKKWRIYSISIMQGSLLDERLQAAKDRKKNGKGGCSRLVREALQDAPRLRVENRDLEEQVEYLEEQLKKCDAIIMEQNHALGKHLASPCKFCPACVAEGGVE